MDQRLLATQRRINSLASKAASPPVSDDPELQAQLARFLCVLASGFIEQAVVAILESHARSQSSPRVARYVDSQLSRLNNAKFEDILVLLSGLDPNWRDHFERSTSLEVKDAINSIVNNRNLIAHGQLTGISLGTFNQYYRALNGFIGDLESFIKTP